MYNIRLRSKPVCMKQVFYMKLGLVLQEVMQGVYLFQSLVLSL